MKLEFWLDSELSKKYEPKHSTIYKLRANEGIMEIDKVVCWPLN